MVLGVPQTIVCRNCGHSQEFPVYRSVNVTSDPALKDRLIRGELTTFTCEQCGHGAQVVYSLLYHDVARALMVWQVPEGEPDAEARLPYDPVIEEALALYRLRFVRTRNELIEKILLFDAELDDRVVELFKVLLRAKIAESGHGPAPLFFSQLDPMGDGRRMHFVLVAPDGLVPMSVSWQDEYERLAAQFKPHLPSDEEQRGQWLRVDEDYARSLMG